MRYLIKTRLVVWNLYEKGRSIYNTLISKFTTDKFRFGSMETFHSKALYEVYLRINDTFFLVPFCFKLSFEHMKGFPLLFIILVVFLIHEIHHILNIKCDISLTFRGLYSWLHTNTVLSKIRFLLFISLPFIVLTVIPAINFIFSIR